MSAWRPVSTYVGMGPDLRFLGTPPKAVGNGLESVVTGVLAGGAPEPSWIAIDDGTDGWVALASGCSSAERACGVVAASADDALVKAQRLGVGGAMWLPPSSVGAAEAFVAATSAMTPTEGHEANIIDLMQVPYGFGIGNSEGSNLSIGNLCCVFYI